MTFPVIQSITETSFPSTTSGHSVSMPASVNSGDLLLIFFSSFGSTRTHSSISGWTDSAHEVGEATIPGTFSIYSKISDGTEGGTTVNINVTPNATAAAQVFRVTGWFGTISTGLNLSSHNFAVSSAPNSPSLNPPSWGTEDTLWISSTLTVDDDGTISSYPTNYTAGANTLAGGGGNNSAAVGTAYRNLNAASEDPGAFALSELEGWIAITLAIRPGEAATGTNLQINIGDVWKEVPAVQINIGDVWKEVVGMQINIGDSWKTIF